MGWPLQAHGHWAPNTHTHTHAHTCTPESYMCYCICLCLTWGLGLGVTSLGRVMHWPKDGRPMTHGRATSGAQTLCS